MKHLNMSLLTSIIALANANLACAAQFDIEWMQQVGTAGYDEILAVATDTHGNIVTTGRTGGSWGAPASPNQDAFISKYDSTGGLLWLRQLSSNGGDLWSYGVSTDGAGNVYFGGHTQGSNFGEHLGDWDAYAGKYDAAGNLLWTRQFGSTNSEATHSVAADLTGNVYVVGYTSGNFAGPNTGGRDGFLTKISAAGVHQWSRQFGTTQSVEATDVTVDFQGNVLVAGLTEGSLASPNAGSADAFVSKFSPEGQQLWTKQFGTVQRDESYGVTTDAQGGIYVAGFTDGNLAGQIGGRDAFLAKYDSAGSPVWKRQFGSMGFDEITDVAADEAGVYVSGATRGQFTQPSAGQSDLFAAGFTLAGDLRWRSQLGTRPNDFLGGVAVDNVGGIYLAGYTQGALASPVGGLGDAVLLKVAIPEAPSIAMASWASFALLSIKRARRAPER